MVFLKIRWPKTRPRPLSSLTQAPLAAALLVPCPPSDLSAQNPAGQSCAQLPNTCIQRAIGACDWWLAGDGGLIDAPSAATAASTCAISGKTSKVAAFMRLWHWRRRLAPPNGGAPQNRIRIFNPSLTFLTPLLGRLPGRARGPAAPIIFLTGQSIFTGRRTSERTHGRTRSLLLLRETEEGPRKGLARPDRRERDGQGCCRRRQDSTGKVRATIFTIFVTPGEAPKERRWWWWWCGCDGWTDE
ncbi:hypothetical protein QR685DRAFT_154877 [Neurospora intermedia]|uniref:Uncharacterized protein n=1 Tax=Neurospora intermedia TaxID=5142 RepID=A0ABR3DJG0_NEUIN